MVIIFFIGHPPQATMKERRARAATPPRFSGEKKSSGKIFEAETPSIARVMWGFLCGPRHRGSTILVKRRADNDDSGQS